MEKLEEERKTSKFLEAGSNKWNEKEENLHGMDRQGRMEEERLPRKMLEWCPPGRRRKGRLRNSWMQDVTTGMREREINNLEWVDREGRRRKIKL